MIAALGAALAMSVAAAPLERARVAEANHRFHEARTELGRHLARHPREGAAWLQLASVSLVAGDLVAGRDACEQASPWVDSLATLACRGRVALFTGEYARAFRPLDILLRHPHFASRQDAQALWASGVAAELAAASGESERADFYFERALAGNQRSLPLRAAWLDHLLSTQRAAAVLEVTDPWSSPTPLALRRLVALRMRGELEQEASAVRYFDWLFSDAIQRREFVHGREIARFYLDVLSRPELALEAARHNLDRQREPEDFVLYQRAVRAVEVE